MKRQIIIMLISFVIAWLVSCSHIPPAENMSLQSTPSPSIAWDTSSDSRIVLATLCCDGPVVEELVRPYIPEAQVWSDGRFLWSMQDDYGTRQVFVEQLSTTEMTGLLKEIVASGFFDWNEQYLDEPVADAASHCLTVTLTDQDKTVCVTHDGAPDEIYTLFTWLSQGADTSGTLYWPETAYLTGFQLESTGAPLPQPDVTWPAPLTYMPITKIINGFWLDDEETLRLLWLAANNNPYHMPVVADENGRYRLILQVPGVTWIEP